VLNAIDATAKGGHIDIRATQHDGVVEISVADDGCGITPGQAEKVFQPYFTTKRNGTGLGLFVTRKLVADHGGRVEFSSCPGQGSVFRVLLPVPPAPEKELQNANCKMQIGNWPEGVPAAGQN